LNGSTPAANPTLTLTGGAATATLQAVLVGNSNQGTLNITGGATVSNLNGRVGDNGNCTGTVTVKGAGYTWSNSSVLSVGNGGDGTLTIQNGGTVSNTMGVIGVLSGSTGTVNVDGVGSTWNSTELRIGDLAGDGTLAIQNGGSVSSSGISYIGTFSDSTGAVTVDGSGSTWSTSGALYVGGDIGVAGGSANLTVQGGGLVDVGTLAKVWGPGQVNLAAGTINAAQFELAGGTLTGFGIVNAEITGGSTITATGGVLTVGNAASTRGSVFLDVLLDGDYDDSGDVALGDLNLVLFDWNEDGSVLTTDWIHQRPASGTTVGLAELNGVLFNWGNSAAVATVPEPAAGRLSVLGVLALGIRRRR